ncbi:MAG: DUF4296 domain-containing protein [Paludibacter sp.]|nr:DUF4296 domain-containing protein [Paludibacter sp.]
MFKKVFPYLLFVGILLHFFACSNRPDDVLSQSEMRKFLVDLHILEATLDEHPPVNERERAYYYNALFLKHGITKAIFDSSLVYYTKNPKLFERVYTRVVKDLEDFKTDVHKGKYFPELPDSIKFNPAESEIWYLPVAFQISKDSTRRKLAFTIKNFSLMTKDVYQLRFLIRVAPGDSSRNVYAALRIHYADGNVDSLTHKVYRDSVLRRYTFRFRAARNVSIDSLSGVFYGSSHYAGKLNAKVDSISLKRVYIPALQDSLRIHLDTVKIKVAKSVPAVTKPVLPKRLQ